MSLGKQAAKYVIADFISAATVWGLFNLLRYYHISVYVGFNTPMDYFTNSVVWEVQFIMPFFWIMLHYFSGYYNKPFGKSRLQEFFTTLGTVLTGVVIIFFIVILNDRLRSFDVYYQLFFFLFTVQFLFTYGLRTLITLRGIAERKRKSMAMNVVVIGTGNKAMKIAAHLSDTGYNLIGYISSDKESAPLVPPDLCLGSTDDLHVIVPEQGIDEIIVAVSITDNEDLLSILYPLYRYKLPVKILAEKSNLLSKVKIKTIKGLPLVDVTDNNFSEAAKNIKLWTDKLIALLALTLLSPLYIYIMSRIRRESPGPSIYRQERIGYRGRPFLMYKFRTMYTTAEDLGPSLSFDNDPRITPFGRIMRKYRIDELPQFWNVLKGDMSLVGPRPERKYYIDQIVRQAPYYYLLHNVRPGITSLGMVKYGYAANIDQMLERLEYDILYYENMSLLLDITILFYTINTVITGKGI